VVRPAAGLGWEQRNTRRAGEAELIPRSTFGLMLADRLVGAYECSSRPVRGRGLVWMFTSRTGDHG